jgi:hypothetical protein
MHVAARSIRAEWTYRHLLNVVPDAAAALSEAEGELELALAVSRVEIEQYLEPLRSRQKLISPLLLHLCGEAGLDPLSVASAILPTPIAIHPSNGHPWLATGTPPYDNFVKAAGRSLGGKPNDSLVVRARSDPRGGLCVWLDGETLEMSAVIGSSMIATDGSGTELTLDQALPETLMDAIVGRPIGTLVSHSALEDPRYVVTQARNRDGGAWLRFHCEPVALPTGSPQPPYLHSDPCLHGIPATEDLIRRRRDERRLLSVAPSVELINANHLIELINLTRPASHGLPPPTLDMIEEVELEGIATDR